MHCSFAHGSENKGLAILLLFLLVSVIEGVIQIG